MSGFPSKGQWARLTDFLFAKATTVKPYHSFGRHLAGRKKRLEKQCLYVAPMQIIFIKRQLQKIIFPFTGFCLPDKMSTKTVIRSIP